MGLLDSMIGALAGGRGAGQGGTMPGGGLFGGGAKGALLGAVLAMLANGQQRGGGGIGGLGDLIGRFTQAGMGDTIGSWIGAGQNRAISGAQLTNVLGDDAIGQIAAQLGLAPEETANQLSEVLPDAVDRLTPDGQAPEGGLGEIDDLLDQLRPR